MHKLSSFFKFSAIGAGISLLGALASAISTTHQTLEEKAAESSEAYESLRSEVASLNSELETTQQRIAELKGKGSLSFVEKQELTNLERANAALERQAGLQQQAASLANRQAAGYAASMISAKSETKDRIVVYDEELATEISVPAPERIDRIDKAQIDLERWESLKSSIAEETDSQSREELRQEQQELEDTLNDNIRFLLEHSASLYDSNGQPLREYQHITDRTEALFDEYIRVMDTNSQGAYTSIEGILERTLHQDVLPSIRSQLESGSSLEDALASVWSAGLEADAGNAGVAQEDFLQYLSIFFADLEKSVPQMRKELQASLESTGQYSMGSADPLNPGTMEGFLSSLSDQEVRIVYDLVASGKTGSWKLEDFQAAVEEQSRFDLSESAAGLLEQAAASGSQLQAAMAASFSGSGLDTSQISQLTSLFQQLDSYDPARLFVETASGVQLNREELRRLNAEYQNQNAAAAGEEGDRFDSESFFLRKLPLSRSRKRGSHRCHPSTPLWGSL